MSDNKKVLTARAWGVIYTNPLDYDDEEIRLSDRCALVDTHQMSNHVDTLVVYIQGLTHDQMESDIIAGLDLLDVVRRPGAVKVVEPEVCQYKKVTHDGAYGYEALEHPFDNSMYAWVDPKFCQSCGRKVSIKDTTND